jgi:hypothetical protein
MLFHRAGVRAHSLLAFFCVVIVAVVVIPFTPQTTAAETEMRVYTGQYVGTGAARTITGLPFQPQLILIKSDTAAGALVFKTDTMPTTNTALMTNGVDIATSSVLLNSTGFTLDSNANVNALNVRYTYQAFGGSDCSSSGEFCTGFYLGDGLATKKITTGFQPDIVWVKRSGFSANWRSSSMPTNHGQYFDATIGNTTGTLFTVLDADGFNVGLTNNANLGVYYYVAFKHSANKTYSGTYTGNGVDNRDITGVGFAPDIAIIKNASAAVSSVVSKLESNGDYSGLATATANASNHIQRLNTDGFQVGNSTSVNTNAQTIYYMAFAASSPVAAEGSYQMKSGSYTGTGVSFSINSLGFQPDLVIIKHNDQATDRYAVFRTKTMKGNTTAYFANAAAVFINGITSLDTTGFTIGTAAEVNTNGDTYYWTAFGNAWDAEDSIGAADFVVGAYTGTGVDNSNISQLPFQSDMVTVRGVGATTAVWRPSSVVGDYSLMFSAAAGAANNIQLFDTTGFQVGTSTQVNTAGVLYHYFGFRESARFDVGNYIGTGAVQSITSVPFNPGQVWAKDAAGLNAAVMRSSVQTGNATSPFMNLPTRIGAITSLDSTGFTLGTDVGANSNSIVYNYAAWVAPDTTSPTAVVTYSDADGTVGLGQAVVITATFDESLSDSPGLQIALGGAQTVAAAAMTKVSETVYTYTHTTTAGDGAVSVQLSVGADSAGNTVVGTPISGASFVVDGTPPSDVDSVLVSSLTTIPSALVSVVPSSDNSNTLWLAPAGTTNFATGYTVTSSTGSATAIVAPSTPGEYRLYVMDVAGNSSSASSAIVTVAAASSSGGGGGGGSSYVAPAVVQSSVQERAVPVVQEYDILPQTVSRQQKTKKVTKSKVIPKVRRVVAAGLSDETSCKPYLVRNSVPLSSNNSKAEIIKIQKFLNQYEGFDLVVTGFYDKDTWLAVRKFQKRYYKEVLKTPKPRLGTGLIYANTRAKINQMVCQKSLDIVQSTSIE